VVCLRLQHAMEGPRRSSKMKNQASTLTPIMVKMPARSWWTSLRNAQRRMDIGINSQMRALSEFVPSTSIYLSISCILFASAQELLSTFNFPGLHLHQLHVLVIPTGKVFLLVSKFSCLSSEGIHGRFMPSGC
jgi:hypothetical protein